MNRKTVSEKRFRKILCEVGNENHGERKLYLTNTYSGEVNRFFKGDLNDFIYRCDCEYCAKGKLANYRRQNERAKDEIRDYFLK